MYKTFNDAYDNARNKISKTGNQAAAYVQAHWIDYVLIFLILFILNAFDVFILKRSDRFLSPEYWYHSVCRITAYILAGILGVRVGYPKAKVACRELWDALSKNGHLIILKEQNGVLFSDFIDTINIEVKKSAWIAKINKKLAKLDKFSPSWFPLYYKIPKEEYLAKYRLLKGVMKWRVKRYCTKRQTLEALLVKDFIDNNIEILNVKFPRVFSTDFTQTTSTLKGFSAFHTRPNVKFNSAKMIGSSVIFAIIVAIVAGSVKFSIDEALVEARTLAIFSIVINSVLDIGMTLWKYVSARLECPRIVRQEDLRAVLDQNEILVRFKKTLSSEAITEYDNAVKELKNAKTTE